MTGWGLQQVSLHHAKMHVYADSNVHVDEFGFEFLVA
jgi:hypothetical protein